MVPATQWTEEAEDSEFQWHLQTWWSPKVKTKKQHWNNLILPQRLLKDAELDNKLSRWKENWATKWNLLGDNAVVSYAKAPFPKD